MKSRLSKIVTTSTFALSLAVLSTVLPASAQTDGTTDPTVDNTTPNTTTTDTDYRAADDGFDWGWLGLIGLAGLAGLSGKRNEPARYRDPSEGTTTTKY